MNAMGEDKRADDRIAAADERGGGGNMVDCARLIRRVRALSTLA